MHPGSPLSLDAASIEELAGRVVELLGKRSLSDDLVLVDAAEVAHRSDIDRSWVYAHAAPLGAVRLGQGPRARLRFDLHVFAEAPTAALSLSRPRRCSAVGGPSALNVAGRRERSG